MPHARFTDPSTSHQAAQSVNNITDTKRHILYALTTPATDLELIERYRSSLLSPKASDSGIRSRRAELVDEGLVKDSGARVVLPSGRKAIIWQVA